MIKTKGLNTAYNSHSKGINKMNKYHQETVNMSSPRTGQAIMDTMREMAEGPGLSYRVQANKDKPGRFRVGFSSLRPYNHVAILTGDNLDKMEVQPEAIYEKVAVGRAEWEGVVLAVGFRKEDVEKAVNKIVADLESRL
jgi:hypothetical protein